MPYAVPGIAPGPLLAPSVLRAGDLDGDHRLSALEFEKLGQKWFDQWDSSHSGRLTAADLEAGISTTFHLSGSSSAEAPGPTLDGRRQGLTGARGLEFNYVHADLEFNGHLLPDVAVRYKGNGTYLQSAQQLKRPFKVDLNEFVKGQKLGGVAKLNLHNSVMDASWMNEALAYRLYRDAGVPAPRVGFARVRLSVPNLHTNTMLGLYTLVENIDSSFAEEHFGTRKGVILKPSTPQLFNYLGDDWEKYKATYDPKTPVYASQAKRLIAFARLLTESDDRAFAAAAAGFVDFDEVSRFLAVTVWISTLDSILGMGQNFVIYLHPKTQKFQLLPWDLDHAFGQFGPWGSQADREQLSILEAWTPEVRFLSRLMQIPEFKTAYLAHLREFQQSLFQPARLTRQVDELATVLRDSVRLDGAAKLARFEQAVAGESIPAETQSSASGSSGPARDPRNRPPEWNTVKPVKAFVGVRHASVAAQLAGTDSGKPLASSPYGRPGTWLAHRWMAALDQDGDQQLTRSEFTSGLKKWMAAWMSKGNVPLDENTLVEGLSDALEAKSEP
jgi:hypothetical protein